MYKNIYGKNRVERAWLMYKNIPPKGYDRPPTGLKSFRELGITAKFTNESLYVEDFDNPQMNNRKFVVVRSQKFTVQRPRYYFISIIGKFEDLINSSRPGNYLGFCSCRDYNRRCKHKRAIEYVIQNNTYDFRAGDIFEVLSLNLKF